MTTVLDGLNGIGDLDQLAGGSFGVGIGAVDGEFHAAAISSLSTPRVTILSASFGTAVAAASICRGLGLLDFRAELAGEHIGWLRTR